MVISIRRGRRNARARACRWPSEPVPDAAVGLDPAERALARQSPQVLPRLQEPRAPLTLRAPTPRGAFAARRSAFVMACWRPPFAVAGVGPRARAAQPVEQVARSRSRSRRRRRRRALVRHGRLAGERFDPTHVRAGERRLPAPLRFGVGAGAGVGVGVAVVGGAAGFGAAATRGGSLRGWRSDRSAVRRPSRM